MEFYFVFVSGEFYAAVPVANWGKVWESISRPDFVSVYSVTL